MQITSRCRKPGPQGVEHYEEGAEMFHINFQFWYEKKNCKLYKRYLYNVCFTNCIIKLYSYRWPLWLNFPFCLAKDLVACSSELANSRELNWITLRGRNVLVVAKANKLMTRHSSSLFTSPARFGTRRPTGYFPSKLWIKWFVIRYSSST